MKIYYLEFENSIKFYNNEYSIEFSDSKLLEYFINYMKNKFGNKLKLVNLVGE